MYYYYVKTRGDKGIYSFEDFVRTQNEIKQAFDNLLKESIRRLTNS
jgi:predicted xylose isomerase-like sugar epimerase